MGVALSPSPQSPPIEGGEEVEGATMERMELKAAGREIGKKVSKKLRREGSVPAILYGIGREPKPLFVNSKELDGVVGTDAGWNVLLDLDIEGKEKVLSRITDYQADVMRRHLTHIDFQVLDITKKIKTEVPIRFTGKPEGVKQGGIMEVSRRELEIKCLPTNIPEHIDIDVSALDVGDSIHIKDIVMPDGVECAYETNFAIAGIVAPTEELTAELPEEGAAVPAEGAAPAAAPAEGAAPAAKPEGAETKEGKAPAAPKGEKK